MIQKLMSKSFKVLIFTLIVAKSIEQSTYKTCESFLESGNTLFNLGHGLKLFNPT